MSGGRPRWNPGHHAHRRGGKGGFTLPELLVVTAVIAVLAAVLWPLLGRGQRAAVQAACASHGKQIHLANQIFADDSGFYVAAAADIWGANLRRWHGRRATSSDPFDPATSPLEPYLGASGRIRACGAFTPEAAGFEAGCGGYGYNAAGVGSQAYLLGSYRGAAAGMPAGSIRTPAGTVMFADAAFVQSRGGRAALIEYSFAEPYRHLADSRPEETYAAEPSMHFRHDGRCTVAWADGHATAERRTVSRGGSARRGLGWVGGADNTLFDPY